MTGFNSPLTRANLETAAADIAGRFHDAGISPHTISRRDLIAALVVIGVATDQIDHLGEELYIRVTGDYRFGSISHVGIDSFTDRLLPVTDDTAGD